MDEAKRGVLMGGGNYVSFDGFEETIKRLKEMGHTTYLTPEQLKVIQKYNAEIGRMFLEGEIVLDGERRGQDAE